MVVRARRATQWTLVAGLLCMAGYAFLPPKAFGSRITLLASGACLFLAALSASCWLFAVCWRGFRVGRLKVLAEAPFEDVTCQGRAARIVSGFGMVASALFFLLLLGTLLFVAWG